MGRAPCCEKVGLKRGRWTVEEDETLMKYIQANGEGSWRSLPKNAGLLRCGKSCRLRWINYLRADLKRGNISAEEEEMIIKLHTTLGNRWSLIAGHLPGRTDNEIKNYWNSHLSRRIHTFRRPISLETTRMVMDLAKINTPGPMQIIKRKGGRTSRASMKKNKKFSKNPKLIQEKTNENKSNQEKETVITAIEEQVEERESMVLESNEEIEERETGHCQENGEERENLNLFSSSNEEIESGFLCSDHVFGLNAEMMKKSGDEERETRVSDSCFDEFGGGDENWKLYLSSCFDEDNWVSENWDWNWDGDHHHHDQVVEDHQWGEKEEEMLSWLWEESDNNIDIGGGGIENGGGGGGGGEEILFKDCEKQQALNAWLLS